MSVLKILVMIIIRSYSFLLIPPAFFFFLFQTRTAKHDYTSLIFCVTPIGNNPASTIRYLFLPSSTTSMSPKNITHHLLGLKMLLSQSFWIFLSLSHCLFYKFWLGQHMWKRLSTSFPNPTLMHNFFSMIYSIKECGSIGITVAPFTCGNI